MSKVERQLPGPFKVYASSRPEAVRTNESITFAFDPMLAAPADDGDAHPPVAMPILTVGSRVWVGITNAAALFQVYVLRHPAAQGSSADIKLGNIYSDLAYIVFPLPEHMLNTQQNVVVEINLDMGTVRAWINSTLVGVGSTLDYEPFQTWASEEDWVVYHSSSSGGRRTLMPGPVRRYEGQVVPLGPTTRLVCYPGKMESFGVSIDDGICVL